MNIQTIKLHPKNYKEVKGTIVFYLDNRWINEDVFLKMYEELQNAKTLVITSYRKSNETDRKYSLYMGKSVIQFSESTTKNTNFYSSRILTGKKAVEKKDQLYRTKIFTIIPSGGVYTVYNGQIYPQSDKSWSMDQDVYNELMNQMEAYFDSEEEEENISESKEQIKITERFRRNIIRPFRDYTDKENWVEQYRQSRGEGIEYFKRKFREKNNKGAVYDFYSIDPNADPEKNLFSMGDRITVMTQNDNDGGMYTGVINDIDAESENAVIFSVSFYYQSDDKDIPEAGRIIMSVNDIQTRVRSRVIRGIERTRVESLYMYKTFSDFSTEGYDEIPKDLYGYLSSKMEDKYPPNQMQLEAIIKGILTKDILLVLGPPGTGKTTVINYWVDYFIGKGQRVLISSQNNAAVDNVLSRFKGKDGIVRLGNEEKVQEECKEFLPQNKIAAMQEHFNQNYVNVQVTLDNDISKIKEYIKYLDQYKQLFELFKRQEEYCRAVAEPVFQAMRELVECHQQVEISRDNYNNLILSREEKRKFLKEYEEKNFIQKLFMKRRAKTAGRELEDTISDVGRLKDIYNRTVDNYNKTVEKIKDKSDQMRKTNALLNYRIMKNNLQQYTEKLVSDKFVVPCFESELKALYTRPVYYTNAEKNMPLAAQEISKMNQLMRKTERLRKAMFDWKFVVDNERNDIMQNALLESCRIVGATCIGINSNRDFSNVKFDVSIVDESGQIQIHNALIPMTRARKNLLLGDYKQIPPCADEDVVNACRAEEIDTSLLEKSFFEYIFGEIRKRKIEELENAGENRSKLLEPVLPDYEPKPYQHFSEESIDKMIRRVVRDRKKIVNLNSQFRMPGNISDIISEWFYENNYYSSYDMNNFSPILPGTEKPLVVISTSDAKGRAESQPESKMGYQNIYEAKLIADLVESIINVQLHRKPEDQKENDFCKKIEQKIGIISAYGAQVRLIRKCLQEKKLPVEEYQIRSMVASLDSFQGQERPLIFYSLTRSTIPGTKEYKKVWQARVGFMKELRRLNVAFTRCKKQLIIVGDIRYLSECMNIQKPQEGEKEWPCRNEEESKRIGKHEIEQCSECTAVCERKFSRFIRLLMQHMESGAGDFINSEDLK